MSDKVIPVKVALRCRPLITKERVEGCQTCIQFIPDEPQIILGSDRAFTYDFVFSPESSQEEVYDSVSGLVKGVFKGYNATVLAYGQTGSGKTHTMGGGYDIAQGITDNDLLGIIPRVIHTLFKGISERENEFTFQVKVSYLEIYKEDLLDLLVPPQKRDKDAVVIREAPNGGIRLAGLAEVQVASLEEAMRCLEQGSQGRTTGSTAMNTQSSRSHAIFTLHIERSSKTDSNDLCAAKFHLVDLAGSERQKKTQAEGDRLKEGININKGLLALGNVISALGEETHKRGHIPYRDSKLTRLLQDSLGGNSHTVMIACVSPADSNMEETLSTLRYADRARKIKNKPVVNRDPQAAEILRLKQVVQELQMQVLQGGGTLRMNTSSRNNSLDGGNDLQKLKDHNKMLQEENQKLAMELHNAMNQNTHMCENLISIENEKDEIYQRLEDIRAKTGLQLSLLEAEGEDENTMAKKQLELVKEMRQKIEDIQDGPEKTADTTKVLHNGTMEGSPDQTQHNDTQVREHVLERAMRQKELQDLNSQLQQKMEIVEVMKQQMQERVQMEYEESIKKLGEQINLLQKEKEELNDQLVGAKQNPASSKVSEQRRKRVQELEGLISKYKKQVTEQGRMLKHAEQSNKELTKLNRDIQSMKQQRVQLMKKMKEDAEAFRKMQRQKDKEILQLKAKDRKRVCEMAKVSRKNETQQAVLRRKAEEAAAVNKRLKDALTKHRQAQESRQNRQEQEMVGISARITKWLSREVDLLVSVGEAKHHLKSLMADRALLTDQMRVAKEKLDKLQEGPPKKRRTLNDSSGTEVKDVEEEEKEAQHQIKTLEHDMDLRNVQIQDFQQKLMDAEQDDKDSKNKSKWSQINSLVEARCALKYLLNEAVESKAKANIKSCEVKEARGAAEEMTKTTEAAEEQVKKLKKDHEQQYLEMQRQHEYKVLALLQQLNSAKNETSLNHTTDDELRQRLQSQEAEIEKLSYVYDQLQQKIDECEVLKKELTIAKYTGRKMSLMPDFDGTPTFRKMGKRAARTISEKERDEDEYDWGEEEVGEGIENDREIQEDPDWHYTPLHGKRGIPMRPEEDFKHRSKDTSTSGSTSGCGCKKDFKTGMCSSKRCVCRKKGQGCDEAFCKCDPAKCKNHSLQEPESTTNDKTQNLDSTFTVSSSAENSLDDFEVSQSDTVKSRPVLQGLDNFRKRTKVAAVKESSKGLTDALFHKVSSSRSGGDVEEKSKKRKLLKPGFFADLTLE